jgi:ABC-type antimicrobial peptide transport system permease subunit
VAVTPLRVTSPLFSFCCQACGVEWAFVLLSVGSLAGIVLGVLATKVLSYIVYQAAPKDPVVLGGVAVTMLLLGLMAAWIPAQRALAVNPTILMREE